MERASEKPRITYRVTATEKPDEKYFLSGFSFMNLEKFTTYEYNKTMQIFVLFRKCR